MEPQAISLKEPIKHFVEVRRRKYPYTIKYLDDGNAYIACDAANVHQKADTKSFFRIITGLPEKILEVRKQKKPTSTKTIHFRVDDDDKEVIEKEANERGYPNISSYIRALALGDTVKTRPYGSGPF